MTSGFLVIVFTALLLVVVPSSLLATIAWRKGGISRVVAVGGIALLLAFSGLLIPGSTTATLEDNILLILVAWGVLFMVLGSLAALFNLRRSSLHNKTKSDA
jgi:uncharacterized membrane protein